MAIVIIFVVINRFSRTKTGVIIIKLKCDKLMVMTDLLCKSLLFSFNKDKDTDMGGKEIDNSQNRRKLLIKPSKSEEQKKLSLIQEW